MSRIRVGKFLKHIWESIKHLFEGLLPELKEAIHVGVTVVDKMKTWVNDPAVDIFTAIIPGELDDTIKVKLREWLPKILVEMKLAANCSDKTDPKEIVACAIQTLQQITGDWTADAAKKNFYDSLAVMIAQVAADGKLSWDDAKYILKWYYDNISKQNK